MNLPWQEEVSVNHRKVERCFTREQAGQSRCIDPDTLQVALDSLQYTSRHKGKCTRVIVLYPPKRSHDLPPLAGLYTRKPFHAWHTKEIEKKEENIKYQHIILVQ